MRIAMLAVLVLGCNGTVAPTPPVPDSLTGSHWQLVSLRGEPVSSGPRITLEIEDGRLGGYSGCNWYGTTYTLGPDGLELGLIEGTARGCADRRLSDREAAYHAALHDAESWGIEGDRLVLRDARGVAILELEPRERFDMDPADLVGTSWMLESVDGTPSRGETITLSLDETAFRGFAGCRNYTGTYVAERDEIHVTSLSMDSTECAPGPSHEREHIYISALSESRQYRIRDDRLELFTDGGQKITFVEIEN